MCTIYKGCHVLKRYKKQHRKLPPKETETKSCDTLCVDLIGQYQFTSKGGEKKFQIVPRKDQKSFKMTTKSGKSVYL